MAGWLQVTKYIQDDPSRQRCCRQPLTKNRIKWNSIPKERNTHRCIHSYTHGIHTHELANANTHTHTLIQSNANTYTHAQTHTYTYRNNSYRGPQQVKPWWRTDSPQQIQKRDIPLKSQCTCNVPFPERCLLYWDGSRPVTPVESHVFSSFLMRLNLSH